MKSDWQKIERKMRNIGRKANASTFANARVSRETSVDVTRETRPWGSVKEMISEWDALMLAF